MRARFLFWACVLLFGCRRGTLSGDGGTGVIETDASPGDTRARDTAGSDVKVVDARSANAASWSAWPQANHDSANTRRSPYVGPQAPVDRLALDGAGAGLVIGADGTLYAVGWGSTYPIVANDPATGAQRWSFTPPAPPPPTGVPPQSPSIAVGPEGNVYVAYRQGAFYALAPDGSVRWQFTTGKSGASGDLSVFSAPVVAADGRVYVSDASVVYAFESDGRRAWQHDAHTSRTVAPAGLAADGTLYVVENYGALFALGRDGAPLWTAPSAAPTPSFSGLVVRDDGTLLFASFGDRNFGVVDAAGKVLWQKPGAIGGVALGSDDASFGNAGAGLVRMDRDGSTTWRAAVGGTWSIIDAAGTIYSASQGGIAAVDADGVLKWELRTVDPAVPASAFWTPGLYAIGSDGTLYASIGGTIHAIGGGGRCEGKPVDCDDHDPCTVDRCDPQAGCVHAPKCVASPGCMGAGCRPDGTCDYVTVFDGIACDDGIACSEGDFCWNGQCAAKSSSCAPPAAAWPMAAHDAQRTRATTLLGPTTPTTKWATPVPGVSAFVIAGDGTIYAGDTQKVQSISPDGVATPLAAMPALDLVLRQDGGLYATAYDTSFVLRALGADGLAQWTFESTAPAVGPSGAVYAATRAALVALAPDGSPLWKLRTGGGVATPAVGADGTIYALCPDLWAIAPDGRVKWKRSLGVARDLIVGPGGTTYVTLDGGVHAIRADGADLWEWSLGNSAIFAPALSAGGDLILAAGPAIYRLDALTGTPRSTVSPPAPAQTYQQLTSPIVDGNDVLYVIANATDSNSFQPRTQVTVFAIDRTDQILWSAPLTRTMSAAGGMLGIGPGRTLYVTLNTTLQAIGP